jgi:phosphatidylglycerophosphate synthase
MEKKYIRSLKIKELKRYVPSFDGIFSTIFTNPMSQYFLYFIKFFSFTPNQITVFAFLLGILSGSLFLLNSYTYYVIAAILVQISFIFDGVDGTLARYKKLTSYYGAWQDRIFDRIIDVLLVSCMSYSHFFLKKDLEIFIYLIFIYLTNFLFWTTYDTMCIMGMYSNSDEILKNSLFVKIERFFKEKHSMRFVFGRDIYLLSVSIGALFYNVYITIRYLKI